MRLTPRLTVIAAAAVAALGVAAWAGAASSRQTVCTASDTHCRLTQIEASLARIEQALGAGGGSRGVSMPADGLCGAASNRCLPLAQRACVSAGFARGVPAEIRTDNSLYYLVRATCLD